jgi:hypothetical protein
MRGQRSRTAWANFSPSTLPVNCQFNFLNSAECPQRVKSGKAAAEHTSSALRRTDISACNQCQQASHSVPRLK